MAPKNLLEIDGRTGEGGGQLVRIACALAAVTSQPIRIHHVRGNRPGGRRGGGGGLKSQHVTALRWLAEATDAQVDGLEVGSQTLEFRPSVPPPTAFRGRSRSVTIAAESGAASVLLVFQAVFPFLLFAGAPEGEGEIELEIRGGTNVSFSPSYEYLDQVMLPTLEDRFGIAVERRLLSRRWSLGPSSSLPGAIWFKFRPLRPGQTLKPNPTDGRPPATRGPDASEIRQIDASILVPHAVRAPLQRALARDLGARFPGAEVRFVVDGDGGHEARLYVLVVALSAGGLRWGRDWLYDRSAKKKTPDKLAAEISRKVCDDLHAEVADHRGVVDEFLQDQLVIFQALAEGGTSFPRRGSSRPNEASADDDEIADLEHSVGSLDLERVMRRDRAHEPFGEGSLHARTARWVASELLPAVRWFDGGSICDGAGVSF
ncbi:hypothetical protein DL766_005340 [Monosporascus sp. MC13-8B]|uniref:RNA 3'-terminal phosphate cyclase domain-containing protein n=1 Tax=Monosporascus cannonballus TaxID=155416 RepID=A0ABY0H137_9PEZI|nr:hypothetical protein DL762_008059 [Monosporascus cannonballus]RYO95304.1 hypothetical protein DL763_003728 [Monosporascus cannonballus]RYP29536.1 hypothetical protein DL766_005340 [Monosporascus sp. MC13-8B]